MKLEFDAWQTSLFPDATRGLYVLPLKQAVRRAESIGSEGVVRVLLEVIDA